MGALCNAGRVAGLTAGLALLLLLFPGPADGAVEPPPVSHLRADGHIALAWLYGGSTADYVAQIDQAPGLSVVSPTWWYLDPEEPGALELETDDALIRHAHVHGIAVWPLFGNHIDPDLSEQVLGDPGLRRQVVDRIAAEVRRSGADGVNVDFENLHDDTRYQLTDLVADLKAALPDHIISVDVTAMTDTWVLGNWSTAFDREGLGQVADYVVLMAYDQHNSLRRDGPVAGLEWVAESTEFLLRNVPPEKVVLGLPLYARDWAVDPSAEQGIALDATLGMASMASRLAERSEAVTYDPVAGQDLHTYTDESGRLHRVWLEDVASLQRKTDLVAVHGLAGIAAWRAGFERADVWTALDDQLAAMPPPSRSAATAAPEPTAGTPTAPAPDGHAAPPGTSAATGGASAAPSPGASTPGEESPGRQDQAVVTTTVAGMTLSASRTGITALAVALLAVVGLTAAEVMRRRRRG